MSESLVLPPDIIIYWYMSLGLPLGIKNILVIGTNATWYQKHFNGTFPLRYCVIAI